MSKRWNQLGQEGKQVCRTNYAFLSSSSSSPYKKYYDQHELLRADFKLKTSGGTTEDTVLTELPASKPKSSKVKERRPSAENKGTVKAEVERVKEPGMCVAAGCYNMVENVEEKGGNYCSKCVVKHCK